MINRDAAKIAALVGGAALFFVVAGQILRLFSRFMTWALMLAAIALLTYAAYSLWKGWTEAAEEEQPTSPMEEAKDDYVEGKISEEELDRELEALVEEER